MKDLLDGEIEGWGLLDYVCGYFFKDAWIFQDHAREFSFVATNSILPKSTRSFWIFYRKPLFDDGLKFNLQSDPSVDESNIMMLASLLFVLVVKCHQPRQTFTTMTKAHNEEYQRV